MGWERSLMPKAMLARDLDELEERMKRVVDRRRRHGDDQGARIRELEDDLGRVALLARSLAELCLRKGVITPDELKQQLFAVDLDDGVGDQRLDPKMVIPGATKPTRSAASDKRAPPKKNK